jgi:hypothetical protein
MVEQYAIRRQIGRSEPIGRYEITSKGNRRQVNLFKEIYVTDMGEMSPERWKKELMNAIIAEKETDILEVIKEHCRNNCAWLHTEEQITEYSMQILANRTFLCGKDNWKDVADKVKDRYIEFTF